MPRGGYRKGSGRKPRTDGRKWRIVKIPLTDIELKVLLTISPNQRREILLATLEESR